ncbi:MAG: hypothetical protein JXO22_17800 [Phycisphaerae bacterium]|nr:hypothetical protein [Phycisphaerae bacterium]
MWRKWKAWYAEEPDVAIALTVVAICAVIGPVLYFNYRPCFKIATTIGFYAFCVLYGLIALVALVIAPFVIYMFIIEPVRDWYIERKYGWAKARNPQFREWLAPRVQKLREIGFLKEFDDLSEKQRLTRVVSRLNKRFDLPAVVHYPCLIAAIDTQRCWYDDTESERWCEGEGYIEFLGQLANISGGAFNPENITAEPKDDGKSTVLRFRHDGRTHEVSVDTDDDWLDPEIITCVNSAVADSGITFDTPACNTGQEMYLVCLTPEQQTRLRKEAGWRL